MIQKKLKLASILGVSITVLMTYWFLRNSHWGEISENLAGVNLVWVGIATFALLFEFLLRAIRWKFVLSPVKGTAPLGGLLSATLIGGAINTLLPARAGDVARAIVGSRHTELPVTTIVATNVMERVYDIFGLVSVLIFMLISIPDEVTQHGGELVTNLKVYGAIFGVAACIAMATFLALASKGEKSKALFAKFLVIFPDAISDKIMGMFDSFIVGFASTRDRRLLWISAGLSVLLWANLAFAVYALFQAFGLGLPISAACFTTVVIALTVVVPQAPGFFGVFHIAIEKTMVLWLSAPLLETGLDAGDPIVQASKAFAIVFWGVSFIPVTIFGLAAMFREGLSLSFIANERDRHFAEGSEAEPKDGK